MKSQLPVAHVAWSDNRPESLFACSPGGPSFRVGHSAGEMENYEALALPLTARAVLQHLSFQSSGDAAQQWCPFSAGDADIGTANLPQAVSVADLAPDSIQSPAAPLGASHAGITGGGLARYRVPARRFFLSTSFGGTSWAQHYPSRTNTPAKSLRVPAMLPNRHLVKLQHLANRGCRASPTLFGPGNPRQSCII